MSVPDQLEQLAKLHRSGALTTDEYSVAKTKILTTDSSDSYSLRSVAPTVVELTSKKLKAEKLKCYTIMLCSFAVVVVGGNLPRIGPAVFFAGFCGFVYGAVRYFRNRLRIWWEHE